MGAMMALRIAVATSVALLALLPARPCRAAGKDPMSVPPKDIMISTSIPIREGLMASLIEYYAGGKNEKDAINILLSLYAMGDDDKARRLYTRDYVAEAGGFVSRSSLQVLDIDGDGTSEVLLEYHHLEKPGAIRVDLDVFRVSGERLELVWSGPIRVDTTNPSLGLPPADRDRFVREIDLAATARAANRIVFTKTVMVAAGGTLEPPRRIAEELPLSGGATAVPAAATPRETTTDR
jgi:hypothetical protein